MHISYVANRIVYLDQEVEGGVVDSEETTEEPEETEAAEDAE